MTTFLTLTTTANQQVLINVDKIIMVQDGGEFVYITTDERPYVGAIKVRLTFNAFLEKLGAGYD